MTWTTDNPSAFRRFRRDLGCVPFAADRLDAVRDLIMRYAPSDEPLRESVSRLSRAVGFMGFPCVSAFSAFLAYRKFPKLQQRRNHG